MWSHGNGKAAVRGPPLPLADSTSAERGMFSRAGPARRPRRPGDVENSVNDAAARDVSAACSSSTSGDSPAAAFSVGQPPSYRGRDRQPRWPTGYGSPGTAAAPRAPQTTTATARAAHTAEASPMMMTAAAGKGELRPGRASWTSYARRGCAARRTSARAAKRTSAPGGGADVQRRHRGASCGEGAPRGAVEDAEGHESRRAEVDGHGETCSVS